MRQPGMMHAMRHIKMVLLLQRMVPVSYTHLDVYKRQALNVGNNGKNLYKHIYYCSTQDGCESSHVTEESKMKYEAYHQVYSYTGYGLDRCV